MAVYEVINIGKKEKKMGNNVRKKAWILLIIEDIFLLPCVVLSIYRFIELCGVDFQNRIWTRGFLGFILPIVLLRCFYIPYILAVVILVLLYKSFLIDKQEHMKITVRAKWAFILAGIICLLGLLSVETAFNAAMSV